MGYKAALKVWRGDAGAGALGLGGEGGDRLAGVALGRDEEALDRAARLQSHFDELGSLGDEDAL